MPSPPAKLHRHSWDAAIRAVQSKLVEIPKHIPVTEEQLHVLVAAHVLCAQLKAAKVFPPDLSNRTLSRKYSISDRTVTNWRREGCPFEKGKRRVLQWMARRRYVPAAAEAKFKRRLDLLRLRENVKYCQDGIAALRYIKLLGKLDGQPDHELRHLRAQNLTGRGSGTPQSEFKQGRFKAA